MRHTHPRPAVGGTPLAQLHAGGVVEDVEPRVDGPGHRAALADVVVEH